MQSFHCTRGTHEKVWWPYSPWDLPQYERQQLDLNKRKWSVSAFSVYLWSFRTGTPLGDVILYFALMLKPLTSFHYSVCISIIATGYSNGPAKPSWHRLRFWLKAASTVPPRRLHVRTAAATLQCERPASSFSFLRIWETGEVRGNDRKGVPHCFFFLVGTN